MKSFHSSSNIGVRPTRRPGQPSSTFLGTLEKKPRLPAISQRATGISTECSSRAACPISANGKHPACALPTIWAEDHQKPSGQGLRIPGLCVRRSRRQPHRRRSTDLAGPMGTGWGMRIQPHPALENTGIPRRTPDQDWCRAAVGCEKARRNGRTLPRSLLGKP